MQFCRKCGYEMPDDSDFCPKCGSKVVRDKQEIVSTDENKNEVRRNHSVDVKSLKNLGVANTAFANRIESSDDLNVNDHLFTLYKKLIQPVREIEDQTATIESCEVEIAERKHRKFQLLNIKRIVVLSFIFSIILLAIHLGWEKPWMDREFEADTALQQEYHNSFNVFVADKYSPALLKPSFYVLSLYDHIKPEEMNAIGAILFLFIYFFADGFVYVFPVLLLVDVVTYLKKRKQNSDAIQRLQDELSDATAARSEKVLKIRDYICYVPPTYRTSGALAYFVNSYENTRVSNLKEAVNAYDVYLNNREMKMLIQTVCDELRSIQMLQLETNEQLRSINASVWGANFVF